MSNILLETPRLIVKKPSIEDLDNWYILQSDPEVMKYSNKPRTRSEIKAHLERAIMHQEKHGFSRGSVFEKATGTFVGRAGMVYLDFNDKQSEIEISYTLLKQFWGKGYATELASALVELGFTHFHFEKLLGVVNPRNKKSRHVFEKIGMCYDKLDLYSNQTHQFYVMHKGEFAARNDCLI